MSEQPTLEGHHVRLEPLSRGHAAALARVAFDPLLWRWTLTQILSEEELERYIATALALRDAGTAIPFATIDRATGRVIGSTRFGNIDRQDRCVEIGWTWLARDCQRRAFNTEAKRLMLAYAFEQMSVVRVEFRVDALNVPSRTAVLRLGAREEGMLRRRTRHHTGRWIDWVYYSVLREEWPAVRDALDARLAAYERS